MNFTMSKRSWGLFVALLILNVAGLSGTVTGLIPDTLRMIAGVCAIISVGVDWRQSRIG